MSSESSISYPFLPPVLTDGRLNYSTPPTNTMLIKHIRLWEMLTPHLYRYFVAYLLGYISNFYNLKNGSFLLSFCHPQGYCTMLLIGRSVPQLRHEPIAYWFSFPQFGQFSTIEAVMLSYRCYSIKDSLWLCTLRNNQSYCDSESV